MFVMSSWPNRPILKGTSVLKSYLHLGLCYYRQRILNVSNNGCRLLHLPLSPSLSPSPSLPLSLSPLLSLSSVLQEWIDVLTNAITYAIHNQTPSSTDDTLTDDITNSPVDPTPTEIDKLVMYICTV